MKSTFEELGGTYRKVENYYLPNLELSEQEEFDIGKYGRLRLKYLKNHRKLIYHNLLTTSTLNAHLHEVDLEADDMMELLIRQLSIKQGATEKLKETNQMKWVGLMNNIRNQAEEIVMNKVVFI